MRIDLVTLFPEFFSAPLAVGLVGKAIASGAAEIGFSDPRTFTTDRHRTVDDTPYGGGGGMLMKVEPLAAAIEAARARSPGPSRVILLSPQGKTVEQADLVRLAEAPHLIFVCGRYEGIDERVATLADEELSIGDFVLTGGECAALAIIDGVVRLLPGTLGNATSSADDTFSRGILEGPQYTRPPEWRGLGVPEALLSGHHAQIRAFHRAEGLARTRARRPELLEEVALDKKDREVLRLQASRMPDVELVLHPASPRALPEIARLARAYGVTRVSVVGAWDELPPEIEAHPSLEAALADAPPGWVVGAVPYALKASPPVMGPRALRARALAEGARIVLALGRGFFDGKKLETGIQAVLPSLRVGNRENDLSLTAVAAIFLDRLLSEG